MSTSETAPSPESILFARGVIARLALWPALRLAVAQSWGGPSSAPKRTWLASVLVDSFTDAPNQNELPDVQYVEEMLLQVMEDEFDVVLEDGSAEGVASDVVRLWGEVSAGGGKEGVEKLEAEADRVKGQAVQVEEEVGSGSDWEDDGESGESGESGDEEAPQLLNRGEDGSARQKEEPVVDEDGFTLVQGKGKGRR